METKNMKKIKRKMICKICGRKIEKGNWSYYILDLINYQSFNCCRECSLSLDSQMENLIVDNWRWKVKY